MTQKINILLFISLCFVHISASNAQEIRNLYADKIPNSKKTENIETVKHNSYSNVSIPQLLIFSPKESLNNGTSVLICPGGGYKRLIMGKPHYIAEELNRYGVTVFVLKYRIPDEKWCKDRSIAPIQDAQRAMQLIREGSEKWNINPKKVGVLGLSAGGHLAASVSTLFHHEIVKNDKKVNLRPDFSILIYPVITTDIQKSYAHLGSINNLLGKSSTREKQKFFALEEHVPTDAPPSLILHATYDSTVSVDNSLHFHEALREQKVPVDLRIFSSGDHSFKTPIAKQRWMSIIINWMIDKSYISEYRD